MLPLLLGAALGAGLPGAVLAVLLEEETGFLCVVWRFFMLLPVPDVDLEPVEADLAEVEAGLAEAGAGLVEAACGLAVAEPVAGFWEGALLTAGVWTAELTPGDLLSEDCVVVGRGFWVLLAAGVWAYTPATNKLRKQAKRVFFIGMTLNVEKMLLDCVGIPESDDWYKSAVRAFPEKAKTPTGGQSGL